MPIAYESPKLKSWASTIDVGTILQAEKTARLPIVYGHVSLMPDAHVGMGATVGSVIPTENAIIPAAVGVDIGCGMIATLTSLKAEDLPDDLSPLMTLVEQRIPAGVGKGFVMQHKPVPKGLPAIGLPRTELTGKQVATMECQFGTLGSGNHFVEVCLDEHDRVWTVLHSGSRGIGNQLANIHIKLAKAQEQALEDKDLAYFMDHQVPFKNYIADMLWAQDYAMGNRKAMAVAINNSLFEVCYNEDLETPKILDQINCHHNFTARETFGDKELWITRKGAIKADHGDRGVIPGSMGTKSYIVSGKGVVDSWCSCSHGAGRRMSRSQAKRELTPESLVEAMKGKAWLGSRKLPGIIADGQVVSAKERTAAHNAAVAQGLLDEHPASYKDIDTVMADQADLVTVDAVLTQVFNYKGY